MFLRIKITRSSVTPKPKSLPKYQYDKFTNYATQNISAAISPFSTRYTAHIDIHFANIFNG